MESILSVIASQAQFPRGLGRSGIRRRRVQALAGRLLAETARRHDLD
jgi:hypothetical protein